MFTREQLLETINYDPETGITTWKIGFSKRVKIGSRVGSVKKGSKRSLPYRYFQCRSLGMRGARPLTHVIHFYMTGRWPMEIDHINGDSLDDRWSNLRECVRSQNEANKPKYKNNKSGFKGVYLKEGKFVAAIMRGRKRVWLGQFLAPEAASAAYLSAAKAIDGQFARAA